MDDIQKLKAAIDDLQHRLREEVNLRTELERRCHLLEKLAYRDPYTGLRTETFLHARVREEIERSIRYPAAATLITVCSPAEHNDAVSQLGMRLTNELRSADQVFGLSNSGLAILLVETPEEGAHKVLERVSADLQHYINGFGCSVTSFPVDANLADDFLKLAMERHNQVSKQVQTSPPPPSADSPAVH